MPISNHVLKQLLDANRPHLKKVEKAPAPQHQEANALEVALGTRRYTLLVGVRENSWRPRPNQPALTVKRTGGLEVAMALSEACDRLDDVGEEMMLHYLDVLDQTLALAQDERNEQLAAARNTFWSEAQAIGQAIVRSVDDLLAPLDPHTRPADKLLAFPKERVAEIRSCAEELNNRLVYWRVIAGDVKDGRPLRTLEDYQAHARKVEAARVHPQVQPAPAAKEAPLAPLQEDVNRVRVGASLRSVPRDVGQWQESDFKVFGEVLRLASRKMEDSAEGQWRLYSSPRLDNVPRACLLLQGDPLDAALEQLDLYQRAHSGEFVTVARQRWLITDADIDEIVAEAAQDSRFEHLLKHDLSGFEEETQRAFARHLEALEEKAAPVQVIPKLGRMSDYVTGRKFELVRLPFFENAQSLRELSERLHGCEAIWPPLGIASVAVDQGLTIVDTAGNEALIEAGQGCLYVTGQKGASHGFLNAVYKLRAAVDAAKGGKVAQNNLKRVDVGPWRDWTAVKWWGQRPKELAGTGIWSAILALAQGGTVTHYPKVRESEIPSRIVKPVEDLRSAVRTAEALLMALPDDYAHKDFLATLLAMQDEIEKGLMRDRDRAIHDVIMADVFNQLERAAAAFKTIQARHQAMEEAARVWKAASDEAASARLTVDVQAREQTAAAEQTALSALNDAMEEFICSVRDDSSVINRARYQLEVSQYGKLIQRVSAPVKGWKGTSQDLRDHVLKITRQRNEAISQYMKSLDDLPAVKQEQAALREMNAEQLAVVPAFVEFCGEEFCAENNEFLLQLAQSDITNLEIYRTFIPSGASQEINISFSERNELVGRFEDAIRRARGETVDPNEAEEEVVAKKAQAQRLLMGSHRDVFAKARDVSSTLLGQAATRFKQERLQQAVRSSMVNRRRG